MEEVRVSVYKLTNCGYYVRGKRGTAGAEFGEVDEILAQLRQWGRSKKLVHTKTFDVTEGGKTLPVYLVDVTNAGDEWLLTLWNESHNTEGTVASINGQATVGRADVAETAVEEGHIPGYATYFWFLPKDRLVVSARFQHPTTGVVPMNQYLKAFVEKFSAYVVWGEPDQDGQREILGYRRSDTDQPANLMPRFRTDVYVKPGPVDLILKNAQFIRKIKKKSTLQLKIATEKTFFQKLLIDLHLSQHQTLQREAKIQYEVEVDGLTKGEVTEIVDQWRSEDGDDVDYGFMLKRDSTVHWLERAYVRETFEVEVVRGNTELVAPDSLLRELGRHKKHILSQLK